jgi:hypothetical protein
MSNYFIQNRMDAASGALTVSGANTVTFRPGRSAHVQKVVLLTTTAQTGTDNILTIGVRNIDGTGSVSKGTVTIATTGSALNQVLHIDVVKPKTTATTQSDGSVYYAGYGPGGPIVVKPGQELYITSNGASSAGVYDVKVEYNDAGFSGPDVAATLAPTFVGV